MDTKTQNTIEGIVFALIILFLIFGELLLLVAAVALLLGLLLQLRILNNVARVWLYFISLVGTVLSNVILTLIFYVLLTPYSYLYRIFHRQLVTRFTKSNEVQTYYRAAEHTFNQEFFRKTW